MMTIEYTYTCSHGEQVDDIAMKTLGSEKYAADIYAVNPGIKNLITFEGGEVINIPMIDNIADGEGDAPWR